MSIAVALAILFMVTFVGATIAGVEAGVRTVNKTLTYIFFAYFNTIVVLAMTVYMLFFT